MITAGIDMGSRTVKVVLIDTAAAGAPSVKKTHLMFPGDLDGDAAADKAYDEALAAAGLKREDVKSVFATGAGRVMVKFANEKVTEMSAGAKGVSYFFPTARTIVDVGAEEGRGIKTDAEGRALKKIEVANHHGDLCFQDGKIYVAVNLGLFNFPAGRADSWIYVYDADSLAELARHPTPEVVHGAGGIGVRDGRFFVVGGLPPAMVAKRYLREPPKLAVPVLCRQLLKSGVVAPAQSPASATAPTSGAPATSTRTDSRRPRRSRPGDREPDPVQNPDGRADRVHG